MRIWRGNREREERGKKEKNQGDESEEWGRKERRKRERKEGSKKEERWRKERGKIQTNQQKGGKREEGEGEEKER